jgi:hypothetical protein
MTSKLLNTNKDKSGKITVSVFLDRPNTQSTPWIDFEVKVPDDMVCVGGGGTGAEVPKGALLTASYPNEQTKGGWLVSTKDHIDPNPHVVQAYAIGMKIDGMDIKDLKENVVFQRKNSNEVNHPEVTAVLPDGYSLLGGGFNIHYHPNKGNLATASFPESSISWRAHSTDAQVSDPSVLTVYAAGIQTDLTTKDQAGHNVYFRTVTTTFQSAISSAKSHPFSTANVLPGYALCGGGAHVHHTVGVGNFLYSLEPTLTQSDEPTPQTFTARSKDHINPDPSIIDTYAMGIKLYSSI